MDQQPRANCELDKQPRADDYVARDRVLLAARAGVGDRALSWALDHRERVANVFQLICARVSGRNHNGVQTGALKCRYSFTTRCCQRTPTGSRYGASNTI